MGRDWLGAATSPCQLQNLFVGIVHQIAYHTYTGALCQPITLVNWASFVIKHTQIKHGPLLMNLLLRNSATSTLCHWNSSRWWSWQGLLKCLFPWLCLDSSRSSSELQTHPLSSSHWCYEFSSLEVNEGCEQTERPLVRISDNNLCRPFDLIILRINFKRWQSFSVKTQCFLLSLPFPSKQEGKACILWVRSKCGTENLYYN